MLYLFGRCETGYEGFAEDPLRFAIRLNDFVFWAINSTWDSLASFACGPSMFLLGFRRQAVSYRRSCKGPIGGSKFPSLIQFHAEG